MPRSNSRGGRNNNPSGRNQYSSDWGVTELVRERPIAAAAAAAGAAAAGLFLWSRRTQISQQLSNLSDQVGEWSGNMRSGQSGDLGSDDTAGLTTSGTSAGSSRGRGRAAGTARGMSETGGGNASLGARTGGGGTARSASGRGRVTPSPTT